MQSRFPITDLHRHLDGNIRAQTILELGEKFGVDLPGKDIESLTPHVQVVDLEPDLVSFLKKLDWGVAVLGDYDAIRRVAYENVQDLVTAGIDYAELRFSPAYMAQRHQLHPQGVVEAIIDGVEAGRKDFQQTVNLIGIISRTYGPQAGFRELDAILACKPHFVAVDLAGDELGYPGKLFTEHFKKVHKTDLQVTIHAGEAAGAESMWQAITELGAQRIGHGVKAIEDPKLMAYIATHQIGIESCLTSNIQTSTVSCLSQHPLKIFLEHDVLACINTDDPGVEGIEIKDELKLAKKAGLSESHIQQAMENGLKVAFLSDSEKNVLIQKKLDLSAN